MARIEQDVSRILMEKTFQLLIVDDLPRARQSLNALLAIDFPKIKISEASNGMEALHQVSIGHPEVVVMDVLMPELNGIEATRLIKAIDPSIKIIIYSMYPDYQAAALFAGADAFIEKGEPSNTMVATIAALVKPYSESNPTCAGEQ
jgi:DNA-binding NarL/FixJ family response regulator